MTSTRDLCEICLCDNAWTRVGRRWRVLRYANATGDDGQMKEAVGKEDVANVFFSMGGVPSDNDSKVRSPHDLPMHALLHRLLDGGVPSDSGSKVTRLADPDPPTSCTPNRVQTRERGSCHGWSRGAPYTLRRDLRCSLPAQRALLSRHESSRMLLAPKSHRPRLRTHARGSMMARPTHLSRAGD